MFTSFFGLLNQHAHIKNLLYFFLIIILGLLTGVSYNPLLHPLAASLLYLIGHASFFYVLAHTARQQYWPVWIYYFTYYMIGLHWIGFSFLTVGYYKASILGFMGVPLFLSFMMVLSKGPAQGPSSHKVVMSGLFFLIEEWCRSELYFGGFPWGLPYEFLPIQILQMTPIIGVYGLMAIMVTGAMILAVGFCTPMWTKRDISFGLTYLTVLSIMYVYGYERIKNTPNELSHTVIRIVQPSIPQEKKWTSSYFAKTMERLVALSNIEAEKPLDFIIWPESAIPKALIQKTTHFKDLSDRIKHPRTTLVFGALREDLVDVPPYRHLYNSMWFLNTKGHVETIYDKKHLVPWGEYVPFSLPFVNKLTYGSTDFTEGRAAALTHIKNYPPFLAQICYEIIFPHFSIQNTQAQWVINITNDAWYGHSWGPSQHLRLAQIRAIELGIPVVRSANNGISAVIDPLGRVLHRLNTDEVGFIDFSLPKNIYQSPWVTWSRMIYFWVHLVIIFIGLIYEKRKKQYRQTEIR